MNHEFTVALLSAITSLVVGILSGALSSYITFRLQFVAFQSKDIEREKHWTNWREGITSDVESLKRTGDVGALAVLSQRVFEVERRLGSIEDKLFPS